MQMLQNIGQELDVLKRELDVIVDSLLRIEEQIAALPLKTAVTIYKLDIRGRLVEIDELLSAYREAVQLGSPASARKIASRIDGTYTEFRSARGRLASVESNAPKDEDFLIVPIVGLCMYYEMMCLVISEQPVSLRRITMQGYRDYFKKWLTGPANLSARFDIELQKQRTFTDGVRNSILYRSCVDSERNEGEPGIPASKTYHLSIQRFALALAKIAGDADVAHAEVLVQRGILKEGDLPSTISVASAVATRPVQELSLVLRWHSSGPARRC